MQDFRWTFWISRIVEIIYIFAIYVSSSNKNGLNTYIFNNIKSPTTKNWPDVILKDFINGNCNHDMEDVSFYVGRLYLNYYEKLEIYIYKFTINKVIGRINFWFIFLN